MKILYLMRHAKSSWEHPGLSDFDRPLLDKGIEKTKRVVRYFLDNRIYPDLIISSPAKRAYETARIVAEGIGYPIDSIRIEIKIYTDDAHQMLDLIYAVPNEVNSLMMFGHNPDFIQLVNLLVQPGIEELTTSAAVGISFNTDKWEKIQEVKSSLEFHVYPQMLR